VGARTPAGDAPCPSGMLGWRSCRNTWTTWRLPPRSRLRRAVFSITASARSSIRLHDLRHTHATLALQAGIHPKVISERLGDSTVGMTLDCYSHAIPAMQEDAAAKVAALVLGGA
jgi:integrase